MLYNKSENKKTYEISLRKFEIILIYIKRQNFLNVCPFFNSLKTITLFAGGIICGCDCTGSVGAAGWSVTVLRRAISFRPCVTTSCKTLSASIAHTCNSLSYKGNVKLTYENLSPNKNKPFHNSFCIIIRFLLPLK